MYYCTLSDGNNVFISPPNDPFGTNKFYAYKSNKSFDNAVLFMFDLNQETNEISSHININITETNDKGFTQVKEVIEAPTSDLNEARKLYEFMEMI